MHCLRWWLPIFLLPLPAVSPFMMILFVITYAIRTKPCAYCAVIILGLMFSTCALFSTTTSSIYSPSSTVQSQSSSNGINALSQSSSINQSGHLSSPQQHPASSSSSSCWIDLSSGFITNPELAMDRRESEQANLGWWSAPTKRNFPTHLRSWWNEEKLIDTKIFNKYSTSSEIKTDERNLPRTPWITRYSQDAWQNGGLYIGPSGSGFRLRLFID